MNEDFLEFTIGEVRKAAREAVEALQKRLSQEAEQLLSQAETKADEMLAAAGRIRCVVCSGHGAVERMDSGYMRRFGLREWNGCQNCGGDGNEKRGKGFVGNVLPGP